MALSNACNRYEGTLLTTCFSLRRGHHLEHFLCQGCYGKRLCVRSRLSVCDKSHLHRLEGRTFPALGSVIITTRFSREPHRAVSPCPGDTSAVFQPLASTFCDLLAFALLRSAVDSMGIFTLPLSVTRYFWGHSSPFCYLQLTIAAVPVRS
jgi:hypothetical protein